MENHDWIKCALRKKGCTLTDIARQVGVASTTVYSVSRGASRSEKIETAIAAAIGFTPEQIWPDRPARFRRIGQ